jgi:hypothetical protein
VAVAVALAVEVTFAQRGMDLGLYHLNLVFQIFLSFRLEEPFLIGGEPSSTPQENLCLKVGGTWIMVKV